MRTQTNPRPPNGSTPALWLLVACVVLAITARGEEMTLQQRVLNAIANHEHRVVIPPGVYRVAPPGNEKIHLYLNGVKDFEIVAEGVTMVCTRRTRALEFRLCQNVRLRGLMVDYDPLTFTQGKVIAVAEDQSWIDLKLDAGYPQEAWKRIDVVDPKTRFRKHGMPFLWGTKAEFSGPGVVRVTLKDIGKTAVVGDLASLSSGQATNGIPHGITVEDCSAMVFERVTVHAAPGMGIIEAGGEGGMQMRECRVVLGPAPKGATAPRLLTTSWDALMSKDVLRGPLVEGCVVECAGDDSWSVHSDGFVFRNNRIHSSGRGALIKASNGLIESNVFDNAHAAVVVCPEKRTTNEALFHHIIIRNNVIRETGWFCAAPWSNQAGAVSIAAARDNNHLRSAGAYEEMLIEGNRFERICGVNIVVTSTRGVRLLNNKFVDAGVAPPSNTGHAYGIDQKAVIWLAECADVKSEGNNAPVTYREK